jgi:hypothetical protein
LLAALFAFAQNVLLDNRFFQHIGLLV